MDRGTWQAAVHGIARVEHDLVLSLFLFFEVKKIMFLKNSLKSL